MIILNTISDSSQSTLHRNAVQEILPATQKNQLQASDTRTTRPGRLLPVQHEEKLPPEQESSPRTNPDHWRRGVSWSQGQGIHRGKLQHPYRQWYAHPGNNDLEGKQERKQPQMRIRPPARGRRLPQRTPGRMASSPQLIPTTSPPDWHGSRM